ncbi:hypothetical protein DL766_007738 [Monosporascus sp. MC13-8B]|uniref:U3 small nucleolar RNA-associated protein 11 n=1 Tax=Monosporascus cannonballus TaxID=155416 RepID=A0ABY0HBM2_9PEZI|nr:hypothetical protein DL763_010877 [Monosporascus cannonballus]RYO89360.1 hypothetical protein DL762_003251 [Monosporascus cannonballus]RYP22420.1 hypothetical protein DL766_007738 [Monosporascus sp. MC13-8B]
MSSVRNTFQRRNHRERAQPTERSRLGLLEKHKDYALRAKDHNKKKAQLKALKRKAADRNEDEFYFGMLSRAGPSTVVSKGKRWTGTVDGDRGNRPMDVETVRLLKTQDMGYLRTQRTLALKEVKALEERVVLLGGSLDPAADAEWEDEDDDDMMLDGLDGDEDEDGPPPSKKVKRTTAETKKPKKIVFAEDADEREEMMEELEAATKEDEDDDDDLKGDKKKEEKNPEKPRAEQRQRLLEKLRRRLQNARKRLGALARAENQLELQRASMAKTATVGGVRKSGKKIKVRERKR